MNNRQAFTLIELLVVVAIIVALLAILLPSMSKAVSAAERAVELSNYNQCGVAMRLYAADNLGAMPRNPGRNGTVSITIFKSSRSDFVEDMEQYVVNWEIWRCGGLTEAALMDEPANTRFACYNTVAYYLDRAQGSLFEMDEGTPSRLSEVRAAGSFPMLQCATKFKIGYVGGLRTGHPSGAAELMNPAGPTNPSQYVWKVPHPDDSEGASIAFVDGHVEWFTMNELEDGGPEAGSGTWRVFSVMPQ